MAYHVFVKLDCKGNITLPEQTSTTLIQVCRCAVLYECRDAKINSRIVWHLYRLLAESQAWNEPVPISNQVLELLKQFLRKIHDRAHQFDKTKRIFSESNLERISKELGTKADATQLLSSAHIDRRLSVQFDKTHVEQGNHQKTWSGHMLQECFDGQIISRLTNGQTIGYKTDDQTIPPQINGEIIVPQTNGQSCNCARPLEPSATAASCMIFKALKRRYDPRPLELGDVHSAISTYISGKMISPSRAAGPRLHLRMEPS